MKKIICGITWAAWHYLLFLPVLGVLIGIVWWCYCARKQIIASLGVVQWQSYLIPSYNPYKQSAKFVLVSIGLCALFLACMQPQWDKKEEPMVQEGRDLFIALDISKSMLASDVAPNRLALAKSKIASLLQMLHSERVGLLLFAGSCIVQCPLTTDFGAFSMFLNQIDHTTMSSGTTALDTAIQKVVDIFKSIEHKKNKVLVIFTDGEDFSSNLASVKEEAQNVGLRIITVGIGTSEGAPIPIFNDLGEKNGYQKDDRDKVVISTLNEGILSSLARYLNGLYVHAGNDESDLKKIVAYVEQLEKEKFDDKKVSTLQEQYHYFIGVSLLCFLLEWLL